MPKKVLADNYLKAFHVLYGQKFAVNTVEHGEEEGTVILKSEKLNPEILLLKKQQFNNLSKEAKEVIQLILNAPTEILEMIKTPKQNRITKVCLKKYLTKNWHSTFITELTIKELEKWVQEL